MAEPFSRRPGDNFDNYMWVLRLENDFQAFDSVQLPGWRLGLPDVFEDETSFSLTLAGRWDTVTAGIDWTAFGGLTWDSIAHHLNSHFYGLMPLWAVECLLTGLNHQFAAIRDRTRIEPNAQPKNVVSRVQDTWRILNKVTGDARTVAEEISALCASEAAYRRDVVDFSPIHEWRKANDISLIEAMRKGQAERAKSLLRADALAREDLATAADLLSTMASLRLSRVGTILTYVSVFLAIASLVASIVIAMAS